VSPRFQPVGLLLVCVIHKTCTRRENGIDKMASERGGIHVPPERGWGMDWSDFVRGKGGGSKTQKSCLISPNGMGVNDDGVI